MVKNDGFWGWLSKCQKTYENRLKNHIRVVLAKSCSKKHPIFKKWHGEENQCLSSRILDRTIILSWSALLFLMFYNVSKLRSLCPKECCSSRFRIGPGKDLRDESVVLNYCIWWLHSPKTSLPSRFWSRKWKFFCLIKYPGDLCKSQVFIILFEKSFYLFFWQHWPFKCRRNQCWR